MASLYNILHSEAGAPRLNNPVISSREISYLNGALDDISDCLEETLGNNTRLELCFREVARANENLDSLLIFIFQTGEEKIRVGFPSLLVNNLVALSKDSEMLPIIFEPGEEEITIFSYLIAKFLARVSKSSPKKVYLAALSRDMESIYGSQFLVLELELENECYQIYMELTDGIKSRLKSKAIHQSKNSKTYQFLKKEIIPHKLVLQSKLTSLAAISKIEVGEKIGIGSLMEASLESQFESKEVKVSKNVSGLEIIV